MLDLMTQLSIETESKMILLVLDGMGGLEHPDTGLTELATARTPNLDRLAAEGVCGLTDPVAPGITPGSAPGHLALFGYDPQDYLIGRGVLEALGIDFDLKPGDVAARGNFCTIDEKGLISDRRAGRIATEKNAELCQLLDGSWIDDVEVIVKPAKEHRLVVVFRGERLVADVSDSDPQQLGAAPKDITPYSKEAQRLADIINKFQDKARRVLKGHHPANMVLLRGLSTRPHLPTMGDVYKLKAAAIASYPMYRGLARVVGMDVLATGPTVEDEFQMIEQQYDNYDFFFIHVKASDSTGEDGNFDAKVAVLEQLDGQLGRLLKLNPDVIVVSGDHSTPAVMKSHSWHPVPVLVHSRWCRRDAVSAFSEAACVNGGLGRIRAKEIMPLAMANALKLVKFGA